MSFERDICNGLDRGQCTEDRGSVQRTWASVHRTGDSAQRFVLCMQ